LGQPTWKGSLTVASAIGHFEKPLADEGWT
jgi:hypothetical protein